jgi:hypothetical protein
VITSRATDVLRGLAGYGLPGATPALPRDVLDHETWDTVLRAAFRLRVTGHLVHALDHGVLPVTDGQQAAAFEAHERALVRDVMLERLLLTTVVELKAANLATRVLRGPSVAHTVYPEPGLRSFGDIDMLVAQQDYDDAVTALCDRGGRRRYAEPRHGFDRRFGKGVCIETPDGLEIDLHRAFVAGPFGLAVDAGALFDSSATFALGGRTILTLDPEAQFLDACFHAALGGSQIRLVPLRDVAQIALCSPLDTDRLRELCRAWRCGIVVQRAIGLTWDAFTLSAVPEVVRWARAHEPSAFERQALHSYVSVDRSYARQAVAGLRALRGFRAKATYAATLLFPTRAYVRSRDGSYLRRAGRGLRLLLADRSQRRQASGT